MSFRRCIVVGLAVLGLAPTVFASTAFATSVLATPALAQDLEIHVIDVDQGSATLVVGPDGTRVLIDGGAFGFGNAITTYLNSVGVTDLDYAIATHFDADHIGGLDEVFNNGWKPDVAAWDRGDSPPTTTNQAAQYKAAAAGIRVTPSVGDTIPLGSGAVIECIAVNGQHATGTVSLSGVQQPENGRSVAVVVRYGDFDFYTGGDLTSGGNGTADVEGPVAQNVGQVEVVTMSHHGSNTSSSQAVVNAFDPSFVVISAGENAGFGHPTKTVCNRYNSVSSCRPLMCTTRGNQLLVDAGPTQAGAFTAANGSIVLTSDGSRFTVTAPNGEETAFACHEQPGASPTAGQIVITELLVDPVASDDAFGEWLEITNTTATDLDLFGTKLRSGAVQITFDTHLLVRPGEHLVIGVDGVGTRNGAVHPDICVPYEQFGLANGASFVELLTNGLQVVDRVEWGGANLAIDPGVSDERIDRTGPSTVANFTNAVAAWSGGDLGTPGVVNDADDPPAVGTTLTLTTPSAIGSQAFFLLESPDHPGALYVFNLSSGVFPGITVGGVTLPLNPDAAFLQYLFFPGWFGNLGFDGTRTIGVPIPNDPGLVGLTAFFAFMVLEYDFQQFAWIPQDASNAVFFAVTP